MTREQIRAHLLAAHNEMSEIGKGIPADLNPATALALGRATGWIWNAKQLIEEEIEAAATTPQEPAP